MKAEMGVMFSQAKERQARHRKPGARHGAIPPHSPDRLVQAGMKLQMCKTTNVKSLLPRVRFRCEGAVENHGEL